MIPHLLISRILRWNGGIVWYVTAVINEVYRVRVRGAAGARYIMVVAIFVGFEFFEEDSNRFK